jgi:predicted CXXCH cytochrome family protein
MDSTHVHASTLIPEGKIKEYDSYLRGCLFSRVQCHTPRSGNSNGVTVSSSAEGGGRRRRSSWYILLVIILLLLALLASCTASMAVYYRVGPQRAVFIARNAPCLQCHTEKLAEMRLRSTHNPFVERNCESCHEPHSELVKVTVVSEGSSGTVRAATWFRWGPFRRPYDSVQRALFGVTKASQRSWEQKALGDAKLVAPEDRLCWTCHGNLNPERNMGFPHQPFAANHCLSCHDPHASNFKPLLTAAPYNLCVTCHPMGKELNRTYTHRPAVRRQCLDCHKPHASDYQGVLVMAQRDLCFTCHPSVGQLSTQAVQHQPFLGDNCTGCHEPHGADAAPLLTQSSPNLCYRCHTSMPERFTRASHHPVGTKIDCASCHQPHASSEKGLLLARERDLCLSCHPDTAVQTFLPVQHAPFAAAASCTDCHVPHGSDYGPLLLNPQPNLCYICHPALAEAMSKPSHHPGECSGCHTVHASTNQKLLVAPAGNSFCYRCHPQIKTTYAKSNHAPMACVKCHRPHGSRYGSLLVKSGPKVCVDCHEPTHRYMGDGDLSHRASNQFLDIHSNKPLSCTSTCHNPHGTQFQHMTRTYPPKWDGLCLQCHVGVGKRF